MVHSDIPEIKKLLLQLEALILRWKGFNQLKAIWGASWREDLKSLVGEIYAVYRKNPETGRYPDLAQVIDVAIAERLKTDTNTIGGRTFLQYRDELVYDREPTPLKATTKDRIAEETKRSWGAALKTLAKGRRDLVKQIPPEVFERICEEASVNTTSVWLFAKKEKVSYRRLLYALKKISFPMPRMHHGRQPNLVDIRKLKIWLSRIQQVWRQEDKFKSWTDYLTSRGWSKSRVSHFMHRKIAKALVPRWYFYIVPPSAKSFSALIKAKNKKVRFPGNIWKYETATIPMYGDLKERLLNG